MQDVTISRLSAHTGEKVRLRGWVTGLRSSGRIAFIQVRDGTGFVQAVLTRDAADDDTWNTARALTRETSLTITGTVREDSRSKSGVELEVSGLETIHAAVDYPITPKEHGVDFLMERRHLYLRHRKPWALLRIRDELSRAIQDFFAERDFLRFDAPFFMPTAVEGTTDLFEIDLFGEESAYLSQSGQLYAEAGAMAHRKVYTFGPTFRAEKSKTRRHLLEFWMVEPEVAFLDFEGSLALQEEFVSYLVSRILENRTDELELLERDTSGLEGAATGDYPRLSYDEALSTLAEHGEKLAWGDDLGAPHETLLGSLYDRPLFITGWPTRAKAFYMQPYDGDPDRVKAADLIAPDGYGEIVGGSERIHDLELLRQRIREHELPEEAFEWYLDLRRFGSVPHSGFGLGFERTLAWITGVHHLREVIPFPRMLTRMYP